MPEASLEGYNVNDADGKRFWHKRVYGIGTLDPKDDGVIIWLGSARKEESNLPADLREYKVRVIDSFYDRVTTRRRLSLPEQRVGRVDQGSISHIPPGYTT